MFFPRSGEMALGGASVAAALASRIQILGCSGQAQSITGTLTETVLASVKVPANAPGTKGLVRVGSVWSYTNNSNTKTTRVRYAQAVGIAGTQLFILAATTTGAVVDLRYLFWNNATNAQKGSAGANAVGTAISLNTFAIDSTQDSYLSFTGQLGVNTDTITLEGYVVELVPFA